MLVFILSLFVSSADLPLPSYPKKYRFKGTWSVPYWGLKQPFYVSYDASVEGKECIVENTFNTKQSIHCLKKYTVSRQLYTNITDGVYTNSQYCRQTFLDPKEDDSLVEYLPRDNSIWKYAGEFILLGRKTHKWRYELGINGWFYDFYADSETLDPVRLFQNGTSIKGSHPTIYILDFEEFGLTVDESEFYVPSTCQHANTPVGPTRRLPEDISIPKRSNKKANDYKYQPDEQPYCENVTSLDVGFDIPEKFSWRDVPGVLPKVRDQATCGSCYSMAAEEAASAQLSLKSDKYVSLSVQQFVDCSWGEGINCACDGGEGWETFYQLQKNNIQITSEKEIPYLGISGYCPTKVSEPIAKITGCKQFKQDPSDPSNHELLKKALMKYGPLMVSIRAGSDEPGVAPFAALNTTVNTYSNAKLCDATKWEKQWVDHGVLLTGFMTKEVDGQKKKFLEIMNSWSTDWGDHGFGYIDEDYDCGIDSMVLVPTVEFI